MEDRGWRIEAARRVSERKRLPGLPRHIQLQSESGCSFALAQASRYQKRAHAWKPMLRGLNAVLRDDPAGDAAAEGFGDRSMALVQPAPEPADAQVIQVTERCERQQPGEHALRGDHEHDGCRI